MKKKAKNYWKTSRPKGIGEQIVKKTTVQIDAMMSIFNDAGVEKQIKRRYVMKAIQEIQEIR